jgi:hypothetical protein
MLGRCLSQVRPGFRNMSLEFRLLRELQDERVEASFSLRARRQDALKRWALGSAMVPVKLLSCNLLTQQPLARNLHSNKFRGAAGILDGFDGIFGREFPHR